MTNIYVVRHGQTDWNVKEIVQGHSDIPLNETGKDQARETAELLKDIPFDAIFSSDLSRAVQTAEIVKMERKLAVNASNLIRERNFGKYEGKLSADYRAENKEIFARMESMTNEERVKIQVADVENEEVAVSRVITFLREIAVTYADKNVLVVSHGGVMRILLLHLGWANYSEMTTNSIANASFIELESDGVEFNVKRVHGIKKLTKAN